MSRSIGNRNRFVGEDRFFDDVGAEWMLEDRELTRPRIAELLEAPDVRVAVHTGRSSLVWVDQRARPAVWRRDIEPNFHDRDDYRPRLGAPGQLPFHGTLWLAKGSRS